ncbi:MAG: DUF5916 domain-containing protein, partial [Bacteroidota bacterium]
MKYLLLSLLFFATFFVSAQETTDTIKFKKELRATRTQESIKLDAVLDEQIWKEANIADKFIGFRPDPGKPLSEKTEVRVVYDNTALYVGAKLFDSQADSIYQQLVERDNIGASDFFGISLDTYQDGQNGFTFIVTAAGVQYDAKVSSFNGEDQSWDAVWASKVLHTEEGWFVEMKIPYSAIRFANKEEQVWNVNFVRRIQRTQEHSFWNELDPKVNGFFTQAGTLSQIKNIKSPVRLSITPFLSVYAENFNDPNGNPKSTWGSQFNGGMDLKYGINDAFTLDMTLVPDFGQVQSDNNVLNLSPFEVQFDENRQFFTEGTELFNKADLFYSRRVGGTPFNHRAATRNLSADETVISNPATVRLINASKVSGRNKNGLGIGIFNAVAGRTYAEIESSESGINRKVETNPLTNYNVLVFDQNLKHNSSVTFTNTNVLRDGDAYDANVTSLMGDIKNKKNTYGLFTNLAVSQKYYTDNTDIGHNLRMGLSKISGNFTVGLNYSESSASYDPNDLGFFFFNNRRGLNVNFNYRKNKPFGNFNNAGVGGNINYNRLYSPDAFNDFRMNFWNWYLTKSNWEFGYWVFFRPIEGHDYYEPRTADFSKFYLTPKVAGIGIFGESDWRKEFAFDYNFEYIQATGLPRKTIGFNIEPRWRVSDKFSFSVEIDYERNIDSEGFVATSNDEIIFGRRNLVEVENVLEASYVFTNNMFLNFRLRHYWSKVDYSSYFNLEDNGRLGFTEYTGFDDNDESLHNFSLNLLNIDMNYTWRFAPGSDIIINWKNSIVRIEVKDENQETAHFLLINSSRG